jgi:hypothetical protein
VDLIERLCYPEMLAFGYPLRDDTWEIPSELVLNPPEAKLDELSEWTKPYAIVNPDSLTQNMALEHWRSCLLLNEEIVEDRVKEAVCLTSLFYDHAKTLVAG